MASARVVAQAKVNLFLRVLAREASGYHQIETLFCRLALGDEITVRATEGPRSLDVDGPAMPSGGLGPIEKNLAWRAAAAFADAAGWPRGFAIEIDKRIPVGGGLGGGSADAGGVLRALNVLAPKPLPAHQLMRIAGSLGADVPFLTQDDSPLALGWGRGDRLLALPALPARPCLLFTFSFGVATADAYRWLAEAPAPPPSPIAYRLGALASWANVETMAYNEFERVVLPRHEVIRGVVAGLRHPELREAFDVALMSGSGATVFALPAPLHPESPIPELHVAIGIDTSADSPTPVDVIETRTASHVEPVSADD